LGLALLDLLVERVEVLARLRHGRHMAATQQAGCSQDSPGARLQPRPASALLLQCPDPMRDRERQGGSNRADQAVARCCPPTSARASLIRERPVISFGCGRRSNCRMVGATSASWPSRSLQALPAALATMKGTRFSVWAVCASPVSGSRIISALP